ncbi:MAG: hypothetical protein V2A73_10995 [Pseudomonadota bacterium]
MPEPLTDRLDAATYEGDVPFHIRLVPDPRDEQTPEVETWLSERLLRRLRHLGLAYELPLLSRLPVAEPWSYPEVQCAQLEDEIIFLLNLVADPALRESTEALLGLIRQAIREPRGRTLTVEAP